MSNSENDLKDETLKLAGPVVVFGAGGFIGANLIRTLLRVRSDCYGVNHHPYWTWRFHGLPSENVLYADLRNPSSLAKIFERFAFKTIFNFASYGNYPKQTDIDLIYNTNVLGSLNLLEAAIQKGISAYVHAGTSSEYGLNCEGPNEEAELSPNSHYAVTKVSSAFLLKYYARIKKLPVINLRIYSAYGPFEEPDRLVPVLIERAMEGRFPPLVDPEISRDFIYVDDAVRAAVLAATIGVKKIPGESLNIGTGKKTTIKEIVSIVKDMFDIKEEPVWASMSNRFWDLKNWYADPSRAKQILHWEASTPLKEGLSRTLQWRKQQKLTPSIDPAISVMQPVRLSAVIACYNDAQAIPIMHERLVKVFEGLGIDYEIIFVNDGSPDNAEDILREISAKDRHVFAVGHSRNFGSQNAFLSGMQLATGDAVILLDGDLQDPPEVIPEFYSKWKEGHEVVYGRRAKRLGSRLMNFFYKLFYRIFSGLSYVPIPVDAGDFSLMDRKVVNELLALPETEQFLRGLRAWIGFRQAGVDYTRQERMFGASTNNWRKNIWWAKKAIFSFSFVPLELLSACGFGLTAFSFLGLLVQIIAKILFPDVPHGVTTIIVLILFFGGLQLLGISVLGEYLIKIFEETKKRPKFIRKGIVFAGKSLTTAEEIGNFVSGRKRAS